MADAGVSVTAGGPDLRVSLVDGPVELGPRAAGVVPGVARAGGPGAGGLRVAGRAVAGQLKGGVGTASVLLPSGRTVGALVVVNAAGSVLDPRTGVLYGEYGAAEPAVAPPAEVHEAAQRRLPQARDADTRPPLNTTLAVVATDADLSRAQAQKLAGTAHDGLARAIRPVHLLTDGDTVFALATGRQALDAESPVALNPLLAAGAEAVARAIVKAVRAATGTDGGDGGGAYPAYSDLYGARPRTEHAAGGRDGGTESPSA